MWPLIRCRKKKAILHTLVTLTGSLFLLALFWHINVGSTVLRFLRHHHETTCDDLSSTGNGTSTRRRILLWTTFFRQADFSFGLGHEPFQQAGCPISDCEVTRDRGLLNCSDAVVFHFQNTDVNDLPQWRQPGQRWVFFLLEPPARTRMDQLERFNGMFNWTMTYRLDSDIVHTYGATIQQNHSLDSATQRQPTATWPSTSKKRRPILWLVSHCHTASLREDYVRQLSEHIPVDMYGKCSDNPEHDLCPDSCARALYRSHKFYLAFENSICRDYVTEKFFRALHQQVVPVVLGGGNYSRLAPPRSFIDARDFESPRHLADYLVMLDGNDTLYNEYLSWRRDWEVVEHWRGENGFCRLCAALHQRPPTGNGAGKVYEDIATWWGGEGICSETGLYYWKNKNKSKLASDRRE